MLPCNKKGRSMLHKSLAKWAAVIQRNQPPSNNEERYLSLLVTGQSFERRLIYHLQQADVASKQRKWSTRSNFPADPIELEQHRWINRLESASRFHRLIQSELMGRPKSFKIVQNRSKSANRHQTEIVGTFKEIETLRWVTFPRFKSLDDFCATVS